MKIIIVGAGGLVGSHLMNSAKALGFNTMGVGRSIVNSASLRNFNMDDTVAAERLLTEFQPDVLICAAGFTWADGCEANPLKSKMENLEQPLNLAKICAKNGVRFVYYSSSYVFDGQNGNYRETDRPAPLNVYGRHKAEAEERIAQVCANQALILRLIHVWGKEDRGKNFVYQVMRANSAGGDFCVSDMHLGNPTWAGDISSWTLGLLHAKAGGIWHLAGDEPHISRFEWTEQILTGFNRLGLPTALNLKRVMAPQSNFTPRPLSAGLSTAKIQSFIPKVCRSPSDIPPEIIQ
jgi:dTDP-4-dehydrorhamnose reductase